MLGATAAIKVVFQSEMSLGRSHGNFAVCVIDFCFNFLKHCISAYFQVIKKILTQTTALAHTCALDDGVMRFLPNGNCTTQINFVNSSVQIRSLV